MTFAKVFRTVVSDRRARAVLSLVLVLGLCGFQSGCDPDTVKAGCPPLRKYSNETLRKADAEVAALPGDSALLVLLSDYSLLRKACRTP
jgi:hypothetical protein